MLKLLSVLAVAHAAAFVPAARPLQLSSKYARAMPLQMSDVKGPKDWAFIKGKVRGTTAPCSDRPDCGRGSSSVLVSGYHACATARKLRNHLGHCSYLSASRLYSPEPSISHLSRAHLQDASGREYTYMYLDAKKGAPPERNRLAEAIGQEENPFAFVLEPYFILLMAPFVMVLAYEFNHILKFGRF